jgi:shikimate dehydrogenase
VVKICREKSGKTILEGYNTDWKGFLDAIPEQYLTGSAIILGTGGAASAAAYALSTVNVKASIISRNPRDLEYKRIHFPSNSEVRSYEEIPSVISDVTLIVNATPVGTWPNVEKYPDIPYQLLHNGILCFDMVYNPTETEFMKHAKAAGAEAKNGLEMLHNQADLAWKIWNNGD